VNSATVAEDPFTAAANGTPKSQPILLNSIGGWDPRLVHLSDKGFWNPKDKDERPHNDEAQEEVPDRLEQTRCLPEEQPALGAAEIQNFKNPASSPVKSRMAKNSYQEI